MDNPAASVEQTCLNCQWFTAKPCLDQWTKDRLGLFGECRASLPVVAGWPSVWASYWCGRWEERKRAPVVDPNPPEEVQA